MLDSLKVMTALAGLMKNKEAIAQALARLQADLAQRHITVEGARQPDGQPGITVVVSGHLQVVSILTHPALIAAAADEPGRDRLGALTAAAVNAALKRAKQVISEEIAKEAKALGLPDLPRLDTLIGP